MVSKSGLDKMGEASFMVGGTAIEELDFDTWSVLRGG